MKIQSSNSPYHNQADNTISDHPYYQTYQDLFTNLPTGWIRIPSSELKPGQAPYVHESGRESYRNPNSYKIMQLAKTQAKSSMGTQGPNTKVKKLRLLLQAGAPLGAVEQKAKIEGVDMKLVLSPSSKSSTNNNGSSSGETDIPETLIKKYKRMLKAGLPMDRIQQLAGIEAGASPAEVAYILGKKSDTNSDDGTNEYSNEQEDDVKFEKFARMQKAGIPLGAIQNSARIQGVNVDDLNKALGVRDDAVEKANCFETSSEESVMQQVVNELNIQMNGVEEESDDKSAVQVAGPNKEAITKHFIPLGPNVSFPTGRNHPLTDLVRNMAHTVQKTARFGSAPSGKEMVVDKQTLYNALGAFKGVQFARDEYNSATEKKIKNKELVHAKRFAFIEMTRSIGMPEADGDQPVDIPGLDDLISYIELSNKQEIDRALSLLKDGYYDFDSLQAMYQPGSFVTAKHAGGGGVDSICQVVWTRYTQGRSIMGKPMKYFELCARFIAPVGGGKATFAEAVDGIGLFEGTRSLWASAGATAVGLAFVPIFGDQLESVISRYKHRGELYNKIVCSSDARGGKIYAYMEYEKGSFYAKHGNGGINPVKPSAALATGGRIIVDFDAAIEDGHHLSIGRDDMIDGIRLKLKEYKTNRQVNVESKDNARDATNALVLFTLVPEEYLVLTWPTMAGFSLTSKSWGDVVIDGLKDIAFDPDVFDRLVLPESRKRIIKALVNNTNVSGGFQDLIKGKGEGTVFLLFGLPGTGKTLTAEALAELLGRPLYSISMGTLGTTADELERRLGEILHLSERWNALLLLDEADSFLEARSSNAPIERNAMVSVMLRLVEYHQGIMFLTSNRIDSLDPAFKTRITLSLQYTPLDIGGRLKVWENLLVRSGYSDYMLGTFDLKALSELPLNGREIKNALRIAMALAADGGCVLSQKLLVDSAMAVSDHNAIDCICDGPKTNKRVGRWSWRAFRTS